MTSYTKADCIDDLKRCARVMGEVPAVTDYRSWRLNNGIDAPSLDTLTRLFGSWNKAKKAADLETTLPDNERCANDRIGIVMDSDGYEYLRLKQDGKDYFLNYHRLLASIDVENREGMEGCEIHHKNSVPWCNYRSNLEVVTPEEHQQIHAELTSQEGDDAPLPEEPISVSNNTQSDPSEFATQGSD